MSTVWRENYCLMCRSDIWHLKCWLSLRRLWPYFVILSSIPGARLIVCVSQTVQATWYFKPQLKQEWQAWLPFSKTTNGRSIFLNPASLMQWNIGTEILSWAQPVSCVSSTHQWCDSQQATFPASLIPPAEAAPFYFKIAVTANTCSLRTQVRRRQSQQETSRTVDTVACVQCVTCRFLLCSDWL